LARLIGPFKLFIPSIHIFIDPSGVSRYEFCFYPLFFFCASVKDRDFSTESLWPEALAAKADCRNNLFNPGAFL